MLYADGLRATSSTGGTGALTLASLDSYPLPGDVIGSAARLVPYQIVEYSGATLVQMETGIGSITSGVLTRTSVRQTRTGGVSNVVNPTALNFATSGIVITFGGGSNTQRSSIPNVFTLSGSDQWMPFCTRCPYDGSIGTLTMTNGSRLYMPFELAYGKPITQVALDVSTLGAGAAIRMGAYDWDPATGGPLNLITEFTSSTQIDGTATGFRSVTLGTPVWMPPGFYWMCLQSNSSSVAIRRYNQQGNGLASTNTPAGGGRDIMMFDKTAVYGALPATADNTVTNYYTRSAGGRCMGLMK